MPNEPTHSIDEGMREVYQQTMLAIGAAFAAGASGPATLRKRSDAIDALVLHLWQSVIGRDPALAQLAKNIALVALGGYGRRELFPYSDVDLLFVLDSKLSDKVIEATIKDPIRRMSPVALGLRPSHLAGDSQAERVRKVRPGEHRVCPGAARSAARRW